jgi:aromatic ring hydroxylase
MNKISQGIDRGKDFPMLRTKDDFIKALSRMKPNLYCDGHLIDRVADQQECISTIALTYDEAQRPENAELMTATSHLTGKKISRFTHIHQNREDLHRKQDMTRMLCQKIGACIERCMGIDAANALYNVTYETDKQNKGATQYHENFKKWLLRFQEGDLIAACGQTDVKGDRMLRPAEQPNPSAYLRIKERTKDGIVVEGCKLHISEASVADEVLVVPTRAMRKEDADYAVAFGVPADWDGLKQVVTIHNYRKRQIYKRGHMNGLTDSYLIFDNCFVPWERVFMAGEYQHASICALLFALFHRHSYSGCKPGIGDMMIGALALSAEANNVHKTEHFRTKLAEIIKITELGYAAGFTASEMARPEVYMPGIGFVPYGPGTYIPHSIYANVGRCLTGEAVYHERELLCDISGGVTATFPHEGDFAHPEIGPVLLKYTTRSPSMKPEDQAQLWRYIGDHLCSSTGGLDCVGSYHGGGSPIMEQIAITTQYDVEARKKVVRGIAGMTEGDRDAIAKKTLADREKEKKTQEQLKR